MTEENAEYKTGAAGLFAVAARGIPSTEEYIKEKLDQLAEFESQRDLIEIKKRDLLDEVKVPEEVQTIIDNGFSEIAKIESDLRKTFLITEKQIQDKQPFIEIPEEVKAILAEIDRKREEIASGRRQRQEALELKIVTLKQEMQADISDDTRAVYADVAKRKAEIEAEFAGSRRAVDENIEKLKAEIKAATREIGYTVDGTNYQAIYVKGKKTWNVKRLDAYIERNPDIKSCYDVGDPSVTIRKK